MVAVPALQPRRVIVLPLTAAKPELALKQPQVGGRVARPASPLTVAVIQTPALAGTLVFTVRAWSWPAMMAAGTGERLPVALVTVTLAVAVSTGSPLTAPFQSRAVIVPLCAVAVLSDI